MPLNERDALFIFVIRASSRRVVVILITAAPRNRDEQLDRYVSRRRRIFSGGNVVGVGSESLIRLRREVDRGGERW